MKLRSVRVTAHLSGPLVLSPDGTAPHLDALCEFVMSSRMRTISECSNGRHRFDAARRRGTEVDEPGQIPIPIERRRVCGLPVPLCSMGIYRDNPQRVENFARRFPTEMASLIRPDERVVIRSTGGPYKGYRLPLRIVDTDCIVWFAVLRERPGRLRQLLTKHVTHCGKKTSQGFGAVAGWDVETIEHDWSWWADGVLMRPLPVGVPVPENARGFRRGLAGCCGPYWQRSFWRECWIPC